MNQTLQSAIVQLLGFFFNVEGNELYINYIAVVATLAVVTGLVILLLSAFGADKRTMKTLLLLLAIGITVLFVGDFIFESVVSKGLVPVALGV